MTYDEDDEYDEDDVMFYRITGRPEYCQNPFILKWWTQAHDQIIITRIEKQLWYWYDDFESDPSPSLQDQLIAITSPKTIETWKAEDPKCAEIGWRSNLWWFAVSRANENGLTQEIRAPLKKTCPLCSQSFIEVSVSASFVQWLGIDNIDFCNSCLGKALYAHSGNDNLSKEQVLLSLQELANILQRVPTEDYFRRGISRLAEICEYLPEERVAILEALKRKPSVNRIKELFGSWFKALVEAGILEHSTRRSRGTQCLARDGHVCFSLGEKTIDDLLRSLKIPHEKEPHYPEGNFRADFIVKGVFIEYFGLEGNADYDAKTKLKKEICHKHQIRLLSISPKDLLNSNKLKTMLLTILAN
jgi:hypothetical protein